MSKLNADEIKSGTFLLTVLPSVLLTWSLTRSLTRAQWSGPTCSALLAGLIFLVLLLVFLTLREEN